MSITYKNISGELIAEFATSLDKPAAVIMAQKIMKARPDIATVHISDDVTETVVGRSNRWTN